MQDVRKLEKMMEKDSRRMYSSAVSNYIKFQSETADFSNTLEDNKYEFRVEETLASLAKCLNIIVLPSASTKLIEGTRHVMQEMQKSALMQSHYQIMNVR